MTMPLLARTSVGEIPAANESTTVQDVEISHRAVGRWVLAILLALAVGVGAYMWWRLQPAGLPASIARSNGRLEVIEIDIATKLAGRIASVGVKEGDLVGAGQIIARMDTTSLQA